MEDLAQVPLDSCEHSMLNQDAEETLGNILCRRASRFAPGQNFQSFVSVRISSFLLWEHTVKCNILTCQVGFYHSACGGNWTETNKRGSHLVMEEELCCKYENGRSEYFRCDGSDFRRSCDPEEENELRLDESNFKNNGIHLGRCFNKCQSNSRPFEERGRGCPHHPSARQEGVPDFHCGERRRGWPGQEQGATEAAAGRLQGRWQGDHAAGAAAKVEEAARHQGEGREADQVRDTVEGYIVP